ncbi:MAG: hypothetical protein ACJ75J_10695 [Cytophagaceae bacterium]
MKKNIIILLVLSVAVIAGCQIGKYDDGPFITFSSDKTRIDGEWQMNQITVNGTDSTATFKCDTCPYFLKIDGKGSDMKAYYKINGLTQVGNGTWSFSSKGKELFLLSSSVIFSGPFLNNEHWDVTRSTKKQLWITRLYKGKYYEIHME